MHDIFDSSLIAAAKERGITRVDAEWLTKPGHSSKFTIATSTDRAFFKSGVSMFANLELDSRKDSVHHRSSGLDSTSAKLCAAHNVLVGINLANLRVLDPVVMGRIMQNIKLCRQHKANMAVFSNANTVDELLNANDVMSLLQVLGMSPGEAKRTLGALANSKK